VSPEQVACAYETHGHVVLRRARRLLGDDQEAEDVLHEVFLLLCKDPQQFGRKSTLLTWLYSVTTHLCLNRLRNCKTRRRLLEQAGAVAQSAAAPHFSVELRELLARLPEAEARAAVYYYCDEMTYDEIARVLGCSRRHVGNLLSRLHAGVAQIEKCG
jgi:RNA polymerase sigma-70 factor (ECF subfamily)